MSEVHSYADMPEWLFEVFGGEDTRRVLVTNTEDTTISLVVRDGKLATVRSDSFVTSVPVDVLLRACWLFAPKRLADAANGPQKAWGDVAP